MRPLTGLRILDLTRLLPGGFATGMLAEFGADVLKIEQPGSGDYWREEEPRLGGMGARFVALNRGKRSLSLNLKDPRGRAILLDLCRTADVLVESFRPGVMERMGLGVPVLRAGNPRLVLASLSAFGNSGPWRDMATHDVNVMGLAGALDLSGDADDVPAVPGIPFADIGGALATVVAVLVALRRRDATGEGQVAEVAMFDALAYCLSSTAAEAMALGVSPRRGEAPVLGGAAWYRAYRTACGGAMVVGAYEPKFWAAFCTRAGCAELIPLQFGPLPVQRQMMARLSELFATRSRAEWVELLDGLDCCVTPSLELAEALDSPQMQVRGLVQRDASGHAGIRNPVRLEGIDLSAAGPAPWHGADSDTVLAGLGLDADAIAALRSDGVI
ncbi:MAG: CoA transferase [Rhodobacteraceae bacterium]|nr:CoA transferase [Paracoccaceae bacterium]